MRIHRANPDSYNSVWFIAGFVPILIIDKLKSYICVNILLQQIKEQEIPIVLAI